MNLDKTRLIHDIMIELHFLVFFNMLPQPSAVPTCTISRSLRKCIAVLPIATMTS